jgi:hypothetical protein
MLLFIALLLLKILRTINDIIHIIAECIIIDPVLSSITNSFNIYLLNKKKVRKLKKKLENKNKNKNKKLENKKLEKKKLENKNKKLENKIKIKVRKFD